MPTSKAGFFSVRYGFPLMVAAPLVGTARPTRQRMLVDLPAPLGPRKPLMVPGATSKLMPSTAVKVP